MGYRNRAAAKKIGNNLGEFLDYDSEKDDFGWGNNMSIKTKIDISKPLQRGFMLKTEGISGDCWVSIRYERLPDICFGCGRIGHMVKECPNKEETECNDKEGFEFASWLRFNGFQRIERKEEVPVRKETNIDAEQEGNKQENGEKCSLNVEQSQKEIWEEEQSYRKMNIDLNSQGEGN